jgi:hypothetical protein
MFSSERTVADRLSDFRKERREKPKRSGTFPTLARAKICRFPL